MCICSFLVWKNACLNYREFDLEGDLMGVPHTWYLSAQSFIALLKLIWGEYDVVVLNEWKKKCVGLHRTWVSKRTVYIYMPNRAQCPHNFLSLNFIGTDWTSRKMVYADIVEFIRVHLKAVFLSLTINNFLSISGHRTFTRKAKNKISRKGKVTGKNGTNFCSLKFGPCAYAPCLLSWWGAELWENDQQMEVLALTPLCGFIFPNTLRSYTKTGNGSPK